MCSYRKWFAAALIWFTINAPPLLDLLRRLIQKDIKDKQDHDPIVSSKVLMYGNVRKQVHITVRGVHICPFSCRTLSSLYIPPPFFFLHAVEITNKRRTLIGAAALNRSFTVTSDVRRAYRKDWKQTEYNTFKKKPICDFLQLDKIAIKVHSHYTKFFFSISISIFYDGTLPPRTH